LLPHRQHLSKPGARSQEPGARSQEPGLVAKFIIAAVVLSIQSAAAQRIELREQVRAELAQRWQQSDGIPDLSPCVVSWIQEQWWHPSDAEMTRLREEVRGRPDHPERSRLASYELHRQGTPSQYPHALWAAGHDRWRICRDFSPVFYSDVVVTPRYSWNMTQIQLEVAPPGSDQYNGHNAARRSFWYDISFSIDGGLSFMRQSGADHPHEVAVSPDGNWTMTVLLGDGPKESRQQLLVSGDWDVSRGGIVVERIKIHRNPQGSQFAGYEQRLSEHTFSDELGRWIAMRCEWRFATGQLDKVVRVTDIQRKPMTEFRKAFAIPAASSVDVARGQTTFQNILDYRSGAATVPSETGARTIPLTGNARRSVRGWVQAAIAFAIVASIASAWWVRKTRTR
jgi:hypothetical protein